MSTPGEKAVADTDRASDRQSRVFLLGRFEVWLGDSIVIDRSWSRRKARTLLKLLAVQPARTMHRDQVQGWLWPDLDATAAANNLHKNLHFLRAALAQHGVAGVVSLTSDLVVLASDVWIDAEGFRALAHQARAAANDIGLFEQALALYAGDLLPEDIYEDWAASPREELRSLRQQLLLDLARLHEALGTPERAIERLQQVVAAEPLHEEAHRALMRVYARLGRRHRALRQYQLCREVLDRELGIDPSDETEALQHSSLEGSDELLLQPPAPATTQAPVASDRRASPRPSLPPLYGRERELELIDELLEFGAAGMAQVLFIHGPAGIGKSRLAEQALAVAEERYGSVALVGRSYELDEPISYRPLRLVLQQAATMPIEHPRVEEVLRTSLYLRRLLPGSEASALAAVDPAVLQLELFDEMVRLLSALASPGRPLALLFDDLHAADEASLRVVHHLCRKLHEARTASVVLATYRTEEAAAAGGNRLLAQLLGGLRRDGLVRELAVEPLEEPFVRLMVQRHFGGEPVDGDLVDAVVQQAEGNPLFAGELVRTLVAEGRAHLSDGRWRRRDARESSASIPVAIHDLLDRRLERLGAAAREVLQAAAIVGHDVDYGLLRQVLPLSEREILDALDDCLQAAVLEETPDGYRYRHGLLREAAYTRLSRARRQQLHRTVAEALAEGDHAEPALVGAHFAQSDEPWRAIAHLRAAARAASAVFDNQRATELYEQALALSRANVQQVASADLAALPEELGDLVRRAGNAARSAALFEEALQHLTAGGDAVGVFRVRGKAALSHIVGGEVDAAAVLLADTLHAMAEAHAGSVPVARTYYLLAQLRWHSGQYRGALDAAEAAFEAAQASQDVADRARAYEAMALACHSLGDWQKGVQYELSREALGVPGFAVDEALDVHL